jgi:hypothetical protein
MPQDEPPPYSVATADPSGAGGKAAGAGTGTGTGGGAPAVAVTSPFGDIHALAAGEGEQRPGHKRGPSEASSAGTDDTLGVEINEDDARSMDDELRSLPQGWVRCFDPK